MDLILRYPWTALWLACVIYLMMIVSWIGP